MKTQEGQERFVSIGLSAMILETDTHTIWRWTKKGLFTYSKNGSRIKLILSEILFLKAWRNEFLGIKEAAEVLGVSYKEMKYYCKKGILTQIKTSRRKDYLFLKHEVYFLKEWQQNFVTVKEARRILFACDNTIRRWSDTGLLNPIRFGHRKDRVFLRSEILALKEKNKAS